MIDPLQTAGESTIVGDDLVLVPAPGGASTLYAIDGDRVSELGTYPDAAAARAAIAESRSGSA